MTPQEFIAKWQPVELKERSACQEHFLDLCELLGQQKPAAADPTGEWFCFEKGAEKSGGENGWADVWMKGHFAWEYKGKHKDLKLAYDQLLQYRESLDNPPLLVVCDLNRFEIHTNFTGTAKKVYFFDLNGLAEPANLDVLRRLFKEPESLKPGQTSQRVTEEVAEYFGKLADGIRERGVEAHEAARFLMKLMFCMFAEDIKLLPGDLFSRSIKACQNDSRRLSTILKSLFQAMATGGNFGADEIQHFNGGLFSDSSVIDLTDAEIKVLVKACEPDWGVVEPHIFGTLFERTLDPAKRSQIGAHYTSSEDILTLLEPVLMAPLRQEWASVKEKCEALLPKIVAEAKKARGPNAKDSKPRKDFKKLIQDFIERLAHVTVLDPACGSGNFLYVALRLLLDLEKEVITFAAGYVGLLPQVRPTQLYGIEINPFAQELAQVVIWIGYLQWMRDNGFSAPRDPVLEPIESIRNSDAILDLSDPANPIDVGWPEVEVIIGNPPFLGNRLIASQLGHEYVDALSSVYEERMDCRPDICCYWFEKALEQVLNGKADRAGLLATQAIRGGSNRKVLQRIAESSHLFFAISDQPWVLDGAAVQISMVGFSRNPRADVTLDGLAVPVIYPNLTSAADTTTAQILKENQGISFQGGIKRGSFDIDEGLAIQFLNAAGNPNGRPNSDVIFPYFNGIDVTRRSRNVWIIDFKNRDQESSAQYQLPFEHLQKHVFPKRQSANQSAAREQWWIHWCTRPQLNEQLSLIESYFVVTRVAKHRIFARLYSPSYPDCALIVFTRSDPFFLGILHSRLHEVWALAQGTQLRERESGFRYTPTTCFETFPFPKPSAAQSEAIAAAAQELDTLRSNWLNPPEWTKEESLAFPGSVDGPWARFVTDSNSMGIGTVRYPRTVPIDAAAAKKLAKRTLTNLYNERPTWLAHAHRRLDEAVFAAYGWPTGLTDDEILERLLGLNLERASSDS